MKRGGPVVCKKCGSADFISPSMQDSRLICARCWSYAGDGGDTLNRYNSASASSGNTTARQPVSRPDYVWRAMLAFSLLLVVGVIVTGVIVEYHRQQERVRDQAGRLRPATQPVGGYVDFVNSGVLPDTLKPVRDVSKPRSETSRPQYSAPEPEGKAQTVKPAATRPLPTSGLLTNNMGRPGRAPFAVKSRGKDHHLLKLVNISSSNETLTIFVRGGTTVEIDVPLGSYELRYASGVTWYGEERLFGPSTRYSKATSSLRFYETSYGYTGCEITLYTVQDGNFQTKPMPASGF